MIEALLTFINYYIQLFAIMNPFSAIPTFLSLTDALDTVTRRSIVDRAFIAMCILVALFTLLGTYVLSVFGISLPALRVGGGILLVAIGLDMLSGMPRTKNVEPRDIAVVPIATPLVVGPGTITTLLLLTSLNPTILNTVIVLLSGLSAVFTTYILLRYSDIIIKYVKPSVMKGIGRFMALIIVSVAVEMIMDGVKQYIEENLMTC